MAFRRGGRGRFSRGRRGRSFGRRRGSFMRRGRVRRGSKRLRIGFRM